MKRLVSLVVLCGLTMPAIAAPSYLTRDGRGGYIVTYDYTDKAKTGWYVGARADLNLWNWKNKYSVDDDLTNVNINSDSDKYSFEPTFGGSAFAGFRFAYFWRAELEAGYLGYFKDADGEADFTMQIPYLTANVYYDFVNGLYLGAGVGVAMPITTLDLDATLATTDGADRTKYGVSPMAGIMLGYSYELDYNLVLDIRYRLAGLFGADHRISMWDSDGVPHWFQNDIDFILDNSISVGIRYEF